MKTARAVALTATLLSTSLMTAGLTAQDRVQASELARTAQTLDDAVVTVEYYRPVARGRALFGNLVHWGEHWTPGANWATTLETERGVFLNGQRLPAGKYSVWMVPRENAPWIVLLHEQWRRYHTRRVGPDDPGVVLRLDIEPRGGAHMETLAWYFPIVAHGAAQLRMHWGETYVPIRVTMEPSGPIEMKPEDRRRYVGDYALDTGSGTVRVAVAEHGQGLRATVSPAGRSPFGSAEIELLPAGADRFQAAVLRDGRRVDVDVGRAVVFDRETRRVRVEVIGR